MSYKTVCVAGGGVLGSQIAFQAAYCGFDVTIWLRSEGSIGRTQPKIDHVREEYIAAIEGMADGTGEWCAGGSPIVASPSTRKRRSPPLSVPTPHSSWSSILPRQWLTPTWLSSLWLRTLGQRLTSTRSSPRSFRKRPSS